MVIEGPAIGAHLIEDVTRRDWWPYGADGPLRQLDSLWIPVEIDDEASLVGQLGRAWPELRWLAAAAWFLRQGSGGESEFVSRYPSLVLEQTAHAMMQPIKERKCIMEWGIIDPRDASLHDFMTKIRLGKGKGGGMALAGLSVDNSAWHSISLGLFWDAVLSMSSVDFQDLRVDTVTRYLILAARSGFLPLIPLDYHPLGGYVIFGQADRIASMAESVPVLQMDHDERDIVALHAAGGGLAL